jgi:threonine synthase
VPKAVKQLKATNSIVEQVTESELATASSYVDRFGFFNDPQTGVALGATMKLVRAGTIPRGSSVVVISTAHGLKFIDFKLRFHQGQLADTDRTLQNLPVEVPANLDAVRAAIDGKLTA